MSNTPEETTPASTQQPTLVVDLKSPSKGKANGKAALRPTDSNGPVDFAAELSGIRTSKDDAYLFWLYGPGVEPLRLGY